MPDGDYCAEGLVRLSNIVLDWGMNKCEKCGFLHYRTDPCREPRNTQAKVDMVRPISAALAPAAVRDSQEQRKSTAARKDVRDNSTGNGLQKPSPEPEAATTPPAGTQALPVDTEAGYAKVEHRVAPDVLSVSSPAHATKFNKTAYQREYVAKWRRGEVGNKHRSKAKPELTKES